MKQFLLRDNFFSLILVFLVMGAFAFFPFNTHLLDPLKHGLKDFDLMDLVYGKLKDPDPNEIAKEIIIVNVGSSNRTRAEIAEDLKKIKKLEPKVIGFDVIFSDEKNAEEDSILRSELENTENIVLGAYLSNPNRNEFSSIDSSGILSPKPHKIGFTNFVSSDEQSTIRMFAPYSQINGVEISSFSAKVLEISNPAREKELRERGKEVELIDFKYRNENFIVIDPEELRDSSRDFSFIKDKIVLFGFVGSDKNTKVMEDIFFTPLNAKFSGKSSPDMYGVIIHANIIYMLMDQRYIDKMPQWLSILLAVIICYLHIVFFIKYYVEKHIWYHLFAKVVQVITSILFVYLAIWILDDYSYKINTTPTLAAIVLSVDILYFYDGIVKWMHKKFGYKTYFMHGH